MASGTRGVRFSEEALPAIRDPEGRPIPVWPGADRDGVFVRTAPGPVGGGEPALFVHGLGGAATNWTDLMGLLAGRLDGEALDLPGFGHSAPPADGDYRLRTHWRAVVRLLEARGEPVHLFGNSLGGAVCVRVAARRPELVRSLTLVSPALPRLLPKRASDPQLVAVLLPVLRAMARGRRELLHPEDRARIVLELCYADPRSVHPRRNREAVEEIARRDAVPWTDDAVRLSLRGLLSAYVQRGPTALWREAAAIAAPTLLVWGRHDRLVSVTLAERARRVIPDARLLVLERAGHVAQMEQPEVVARAFLGMLEERAPALS